MTPSTPFLSPRAKFIIFVLIIILIPVSFVARAVFNLGNGGSKKAPVAVVPEKPKTEAPLEKRVVIDVPYLNEAPDGIWTGPWKNACEEAAMVMVERFYLGDKGIGIADGKAYMQKFFDIQDRLWGSNANSDASQMSVLINEYSTYSAEIKTNPTIEEIKNEIRAGRPVIALHKGFDLGNKNIPFLATGSSYHSTVVVGFDDNTQEFLVHDTGDSIDGPNHIYTYDTFMNSLHDYRHSTNLADGPARVLFTSKGK